MDHTPEASENSVLERVPGLSRRCTLQITGDEIVEQRGERDLKRRTIVECLTIRET